MDKKGQIGILDVPNEILFQIFRQLTVQDVHQNVALVCKRFFRISRMDGMVTSFEFELSFFANEVEVEKNLAKIGLLLEQHPRAQLKLKFHEVLEETYSHKNAVYQVSRISSFMQSIRVMKFDFISNVPLLQFTISKIRFEAIEKFEITKKNEECRGNRLVIPTQLFYTPCFWKNFPNLKSLTMNFFFNDMVGIVYLLQNTVFISNTEYFFFHIFRPNMIIENYSNKFLRLARSLRNYTTLEQ